MSRGGRRVVCWAVGLSFLTGAPDAMAADRLVVRFAPGTGAESRLDARRDAGASLVRVARELAGTQIVHVGEGEATTALRSLRAEPDVLWAERDVRIRASARMPRPGRRAAVRGGRPAPSGRRTGAASGRSAPSADAA